MEEFLDQIEAACTSGSFYLPLFCSLTLPDICGAMSSPDGQASRPKYIAWFDRYVAPRYDGNFDGAKCYAFRCAALHQGRSAHMHLGYKRVLFIDPGANCVSELHNNVLKDTLNLDVSQFCSDVIGGVRQWLRDESANQDLQRHLSAFLKRYPGGIASYIVGVDVYG